MKYSVINNLDKEKIFAVYDSEIIRVYQAYNDEITDEAINLGTFGNKFSKARMTWIKTSFLWIMYRSGWGEKDSNQKRTLAIDITLEGFNEIIKDAVMSSYNVNLYGDYEIWKDMLANSYTRCQWDPDRDIYGNPLDMRAIQLGIKGHFVENYINKWIVNIEDITDFVSETKTNIDNKTFDTNVLPKEIEYIIEL